MNNAEKFKQLFGIYATELWAMPEEKFLEWLNAEALEQQEKDRWRPATENPKKPNYQFDTYLVYTKYERFGVADFFADGRWIGYDIDGDQIDGDEITAWRPLPEKYKEEDKA